MLKNMIFFVICKKYGKTLMDTATKTGVDAGKTASKRVVQKQWKEQKI